MAVVFASEHSLCIDYCNAVNSDTKVVYNVSTGYVTIWHYYNDSFNTEEAISRLKQLIYETELPKEGWVLPWNFVVRPSPTSQSPHYKYKVVFELLNREQIQKYLK